MKLLILLLVVAFTAYVVYARPKPVNIDDEGIEAILNRARRQTPHTKKDHDALIKRLNNEVKQLGIDFCEGDYTKGLQCFEEDVCVGWEEVCDGTQVCGVEKRDDCINSTKGNDAAPNAASERENCDGDEHYLWCPLKTYVPTRCGEDLTIEAGGATFINYLYYDNGMDCFWTVKAAEGQEIVVNFRQFASEPQYDSLSLGTGMKEEPENPGQYIIYKHSGAEVPDPAEFKVESNEIWVRFTSDDWDRKSGFSLEVTDASAKDPGVTRESPFNVEKNQTCGGELQLEADEEKIITSPGFPQYYPNYFECVWTVTVPKGRHVGVGFEYFSLEKGADFLEIGDGSSPGDDTVDKLTGNTIPTSAVTTSSNKAWLRFTSDVANNRLGFKAKVRDQPHNSCGGDIEVPRDGSIIIASPLFPDLGYRINMDCVWTIQGDPERGLTVVFKEFQTEPRFDTMSAGFGPIPARDGSNYVISGHSGKQLPDPYEFTTSTNTAWVYFKTDNEKIDRGFKLEVYDSAVKESNTTVATQVPLEIDYDCGDRLSVDPTTGKIVIQSPGYPGRYRPLLDCTWTVDFNMRLILQPSLKLFTLKRAVMYSVSVQERTRMTRSL
ncbi:dorsal-ventral patterning tolloid-like protein 1 [Amphiura filiformis]|uniref:dorsal-ventral patterning tolloid-like protein 1 n=1 Tax=Amphiura filiformis TaxID=82378 RepID=UPI003B215F48